MIAPGTKPGGTGMLAWLGANKDALLAFAAIVITPVLALFGMLLSQRNMARSLAIQHEAMQKNLDVAVHQLVNAERTLRQQARVATAGIVGGIERERLERFSSRCARLLELFEELSNKESRLETYADPREFVRLNREMGGAGFGLLRHGGQRARDGGEREGYRHAAEGAGGVHPAGARGDHAVACADRPAGRSRR